jgi:hypothetical protein
VASSALAPAHASTCTGDGQVTITDDPSTDACTTPVVVARRFTG